MRALPRSRPVRIGRRATLTAAVACALMVPAGTVAAAPPGAPADTLPLTGLDLDAATIPDLKQRLDAGELTAVELMGAYLGRIAAVDGQLGAGPGVNPTRCRGPRPATCTAGGRPAQPAAWVTRYRNLDGMADEFVSGSSGTAAVAGYPNVTVPAGFAGPQEASPIGVSSFGARWDDADVLDVAASVEAAVDTRRAPGTCPPSAADRSRAGRTRPGHLSRTGR